MRDLGLRRHEFKKVVEAESCNFMTSTAYLRQKKLWVLQMSILPLSLFKVDFSSKSCVFGEEF